MFDKDETADKIMSIIAQTLNVEKETIQKDATLESLGVDSLDRLEIIMKLEEAFGIDISDEAESHISTVQEVIDTVHSLRSK